METGPVDIEMIAFVKRILDHESDKLNMLLLHSSLSQSETDIRNRHLTNFYALWARLTPHLATLLVAN